jgi:peroxiredoxin
VSFSGTDPITGDTVSLADYSGTPVVLNVWGSWCPGCVAEAEDLRRFAADHPEVQVIGIDLQDSVGAAKEFYERWRWTHPSVFDPDGEISFSLGLQGTPSTFFLDRQHRIVTRIVGVTDYAGFEQGLEATVPS